MYKGLFLGLTTVDILYGLSAHPGPNEKKKADWQLCLAGGPAANSAVAFAAFGNESHLCSALGRHPAGTLAAADLAAHRVRLHDRSRQPDALPILSAILVNQANGERCVVYSDTDDRQIGLADDDPDVLLAGVAVLLLDGHFLDQAIYLAQAARQRGITVVLDGGSWKRGLQELFPLLDYAVCSADFTPPGCALPAERCAFLADQKLKAWAISRGCRPVIAGMGTRRLQIPVPEVEAIDTLAAGDILHGAFCHYICTGAFAESLEQAILIASESCRYHGAREWIRHRQQAVQGKQQG